MSGRRTEHQRKHGTGQDVVTADPAQAASAHACKNADADHAQQQRGNDDHGHGWPQTQQQCCQRVELQLDTQTPVVVEREHQLLWWQVGVKKQVCEQARRLKREHHSDDQTTQPRQRQHACQAMNDKGCRIDPANQLAADQVAGKHEEKCHAQHPGGIIRSRPQQLQWQQVGA